MEYPMIFKCAIFSLVLCMLLFSSFFSSLNVYDKRSPFSRVIIGNPHNGWTFDKSQSTSGFDHGKGPDGRPI